MIAELLSCALLFGPAPEAALVLRAGGDPVLVGRPLRLTLEGADSGSVLWEFPEYGAELDTFLFLSGVRAADSAWCEVLPTVSGPQVLPSFGVRTRDASGVAGVRPTMALELSVGSALKPGEPARLIDELELERFDQSTWVWLLPPLLFLFGWLVARRLRRIRRSRRVRARARARPPRVIVDPRARALAELERLRERGTLAGTAARSLVAELADVLRRYLRDSVDGAWMFKTLDELEAQLADLERESKNGLPGDLLRAAEWAKFAGRVPEGSQVSRLLDESVEWVRARSGPAGSAVR
jgi:hypothetical protein